MGGADDVVIMVSELRCHEDGCPDIETVIAVMTPGEEPAPVKISKPMAELDAEAIGAAKPMRFRQQPGRLK